MKRSGFADLPLHGGRVPAWLAERMTKLGAAIVESVLLRYGHAEFLFANERSILVPGLGKRDGHGLALVRDHNVSARSLEARPESAARPSSGSTFVAAGESTREGLRTNCEP